MSSEPSILRKFPDARFHPAEQLIIWRPKGILDDALADRIVEFIEAEEQSKDAPFNRYTDFNDLTEVHLTFGHVFRIAEHRKAARHGSEPVKSAFFCSWIIGFGIAQLYEELMRNGPIEVRAFRERAQAAEWLGVPEEVLLRDT